TAVPGGTAGHRPSPGLAPLWQGAARLHRGRTRAGRRHCSNRRTNLKLVHADAQTSLTVPNDLALLPMARAYVRELAALAALPPEEQERLMEAAVVACTDVIEHAFDPGEEAPITLIGVLDPRMVTLGIRERGVPFDPTLAAADTPGEREDPGH